MRNEARPRNVRDVRQVAAVFAGPRDRAPSHHRVAPRRVAFRFRAALAEILSAAVKTKNALRLELSKSHRTCCWVGQKRRWASGMGGARVRLRRDRDRHRESAAGKSQAPHLSI